MLELDRCAISAAAQRLRAACAKNRFPQDFSRRFYLSSSHVKNNAVVPSGKSSLRVRAILSHQEGRLAIATNAGQGAVAACPRKACDGRERTAKSCGPDAPTLASSLRISSVDDGGNKARSPGRARRKPLKPLRRECRRNRCTCSGLTRVLSCFAREAMGAHGAPGIPCALFLWANG